MERPKIVEIIIKCEYMRNGQVVRKDVPVRVRDDQGRMVCTALFWEETTIEKVLEPYYEVKQYIKHTDEGLQRLRQCSRRYGPYIRKHHLKGLWNCENSDTGLKPVALRKMGASPTEQVEESAFLKSDMDMAAYLNARYGNSVLNMDAVLSRQLFDDDIDSHKKTSEAASSIDLQVD